MSSSPKIIINADDLGFSPNVNTAILRCAERGTITAASVMVNMPFIESALQQSQERTPHLSLALHFTLTSGKPVSLPQDVPLLVDANGFFRLGFVSLWKMLTSKQRTVLLSQIKTEFFAQMNLMNQLATKYQLRFDHLDSHQHIHVLPGIWELLQQEATQCRLTLRVPRERWGNLKRWCRRSWAWLSGGLCKQKILNHCLRKVPQSIGYFGILETGRMDASALRTIFQLVGQCRSFDTYEINTHPSALTEINQQGELCCSKADKQFHVSPWREREFQALNCTDVLQWAQQYGITLAGFIEMK